MECCHNFGLPLHVCYDIMKAAAKKKFDKLESYEQELWELAEPHMSKETFDIIFKIIVDSGLYSFNKSHAVAYATLCYETAYYKYYYPKEYLAAELTNIFTSVAADKRKERVAETVKDCRRLGIKFLPITAQDSEWKFKVEGDSIRIGMCSISSFGEKAYNAFSLVEDKTSIESVFESVNKTTCNKKAFNALIFAGAFGDRTQAYLKYCELRDESPVDEIVFHKTLRVNIYEDDREIEEKLLSYNFIYNLTNNLNAFGYKNLNKKAEFYCDALITRVKTKNDKNKNKMAWITLETGDGIIEGVVFANVYAKYRTLIKKDSFVKIKARKEDDETCFVSSIE